MLPVCQIPGQTHIAQCPGRIRRHRHEIRHHGFQPVHHRFPILIRQHTGDAHNVLSRQIFLHRRNQALHTLRIVGSVHNDQGIVLQHFKPTRPTGGVHALHHGLVGNFPTGFPQHGNGFQCHRRVFQLMCAQQMHRQLRELFVLEGLTLQVCRQRLDFSEIRRTHRALQFLCPRPNHFHCLRCTAVCYHRTARFQNSALLPGNLPQCIAQILRMVHTQIGNHGADIFGNQIRCVQTSAQTGFQHHNVAFLPGKPKKCRRGDDFKLRGPFRHGFRHGLHLCNDFRQFLIGNGHAVDLHPFVKPHNIRGNKQTGAIARRRQNGRQHGRNGAFSVGSGNMNELQVLLHIAQLFHHFADTLQAGLGTPPGNTVNISQCLLICHIFLQINTPARWIPSPHFEIDYSIICRKWQSKWEIFLLFFCRYETKS